MDCLHPVAPDDEELLRFVLDGEALSEEESRHLEQCATCQQRLNYYKRTDRCLVSRLYRSECPSGTKLSLYCANLLPEEERTSVAAHLLDCSLCAAEVEDTRRFFAATELFPPEFSPFRASVRHVFATLVKQQAQLVLRGEEPSTPALWPRQYHADSIDLSLHLSRASNGEYMLLGIMTDPTKSVEAFEGITAELYRAPGPIATDGAEAGAIPLQSTQVDDLGNIVFSAVPVGTYVMIVHLPERELIIEDVTIEDG